jgi:type II secretory ATPase GspE/PulE/Tfp pilus assembly ATPase PilB-like protein
MNQSAISPELKHRLREYLEKQGYQITDKAALRGKSGREYTFDLLAYAESNGVKRSLGIDFIDGEKEIGLEQVVFFASKASATGLDEKVIVVSPGISHGAQRFAQRQGIKVVDSRQVDSSEFALFKEKPKAPEVKPQPAAPMHYMQPEAPEIKPETQIPANSDQPKTPEVIETPTDYVQPEAPELKPEAQIPTNHNHTPVPELESETESPLYYNQPEAPEIKPEAEAPMHYMQPEVKPETQIPANSDQPKAPEVKPEPPIPQDYMQPKAPEPQMPADSNQPQTPEVKPEAEAPMDYMQPEVKPETQIPANSDQPKAPEVTPEPQTPQDYMQPEAPEVKPEAEAPRDYMQLEAPEIKPETQIPANSDQPKAPEVAETPTDYVQPETPEIKPEAAAPMDYMQPQAPEIKPETEAATPATEAGVKPESVSLRHSIQTEAMQLIPEVMARRYNAVPVSVSGDTLEVAMADPTDIFALEAFSALCRMRIKPIAADTKEIREAIDFNYKGYGEIEKQVSRVNIPSEVSEERLAITADTDAPLAQALDLIIEEAVKARASDIHIEPEEDRLRVRYRIDGALQDMMSLPLNIHLALVSRIKILSEMNIADRHRPQDGQFSARSKGRDIDIRVATAPTVHGEMAELRLLDKSVATLGLPELGMLPDSLEKYANMLKVPYGMIITSGPTGAGKTTTLYASINSLDCLERNVITIEDPAEYRFKDINQIQVNNQAGITFATGLRSILRLDPDVIMVGEIRDAETANIAVQAALTGHLMLSSLHASDSTGVISRLIDLGIEPFLIASAVIGVLAQRMVRRICPDCSHLIEAPVVEQIAYEKETGEKRTEFLYGTGCKACAYTGYRGRTGIFEILTMSDTIRTMITNRSSSSQIRAQALKEGMVTMMNDGMRKVKEGITTPSEVLRNAYSTA